MPEPIDDRDSKLREVLRALIDDCKADEFCSYSAGEIVADVEGALAANPPDESYLMVRELSEARDEIARLRNGIEAEIALQRRCEESADDRIVDVLGSAAAILVAEAHEETGERLAALLAPEAPDA